jgi:hypothetical protein
MAARQKTSTTMRRAAAIRVMGGLVTTLLAGCANQGCDISPVPLINTRPATTRFGVQIYPEDDVHRAVALVAGCGGTLLRIGINGDFDFADAIFAAATKHAMRVVAITDVAAQPVDVASYATSQAALHKRYAQYDPIWEIWNEPNLAYYWGAGPDADTYATLAIETAKALRAAGAKDVWSGGTSGIDFNWLLNLKGRGVFDVMNGCSVHSYEDPCEANSHYGLVVNLVPKNVLVHTTETCVPDWSHQSEFLRNMTTIHRKYGIPTMIWCELRDGTAGSRGLYAFPYGLVDSRYAPKDSYRVAQTLFGSAPSGGIVRARNVAFVQEKRR